MCNKYAFLLTRAGKILDGGGLTESHSTIATLHGVDEDQVNRYEWQPPQNWPDADVLDGLVTNEEVFTPGASALRRIAAHLTRRFPTIAAFQAHTPVDDRWHEQTVVLNGVAQTILVRGRYDLREGTYSVCGTAEATVGGSASIYFVRDWATIHRVGDLATIHYVRDSAVVHHVGDSATIHYIGDSAMVHHVGGSATIHHVGGSATIQNVRDSATIHYVGASAIIQDIGGSATIQDVGDSATIIGGSYWSPRALPPTIHDRAVLIDRRGGRRRGGRIVVMSAAPFEISAATKRAQRVSLIVGLT